MKRALRAAWLAAGFLFLGIAIVGVVISIWYYFGVIRVLYFPQDRREEGTIEVGVPVKACLGLCIAGMLFLGIFPALPLNLADRAVALLSQFN